MEKKITRRLNVRFNRMYSENSVIKRYIYAESEYNLKNCFGFHITSRIDTQSRWKNRVFNHLSTILSSVADGHQVKVKRLPDPTEIKHPFRNR